ncbi:MAG: ROK family transcriptional regulator [Prevotella sp.]|jgi:predicted NBD/HSP70 family sugar kinase|nr:ROK family transcriptional regulator [Prevotella sp.]
MNRKLLDEVGKGVKSALVKKKIINHYIHNGGSTLTELSKDIDLSIPTVTKFIGEMCEEGFITDYGKLETTEGRYPNLYGLNPDACYFVGVDMRQSSVNIAIINFKGEMIDLCMSVDYHFQNTPQALNNLCKIIKDFIDSQTIDKSKILNIDINIFGRVNPETGYSHSVFHFNEKPLPEVLREKLGYPVTIDNDTRAMTYGEYMAGCVNDEKNVIFVNLSWGLAIGIIIDGKIYTGKSGFSGEFGHVKTYNNEILCHCGKKGCLETEASGLAMHRRLLELVNEGGTSLLSQRAIDNKQITLDDIIDAVSKEDVLCIGLVEEIGQKLGESIAGLINIFNPEMVIIGGTVSVVGDYIMEPIKSAVRKYSLNLVNKDSKMVVSKLKDKAGVVGACMLARSRIFEN